MVSSELGVGALQRWISVCLGLLDAVGHKRLAGSCASWGFGEGLDRSVVIRFHGNACLEVVLIWDLDLKGTFAYPFL